MIQNILTFCVKNDLTFVEGSIPSGKLVANDINRNSIYLITPYDESIVKANFQTNLQSDTPTSVLGILVNGKISVDEIVDTTASYYNLVKDWNIYEFKVPSTTLSFISRNRTGKIGINFSIEQRLVPTIKDSYGTYKGEITELAQTPIENGYYIIKALGYEYQDSVELKSFDLNDILVYNATTDVATKISAYSNRGSTPTTLYSVDPSLLNDNFETIEPSLTTQIVQQVNDNTGDIVLLFQNVGVNNSTLVDLENRVSVAEQDIDTAEENITNLQGRMATAESDIDNIEDGTTIVEKALRDSLGNIIKDSYVSSVYPTYNDTTDKLFIETYDVRDGLLANNEVILPKATTTKNGLMAKEDKIKINAIASDIASAISTHDGSQTSHLYIRTLINNLQKEVDRLNAKGRSWGEVDKTFSELWAMAEPTRSDYINTFLATAFSGYTPSNGDLVYTIVSDTEEEHELEYNSTLSQWVDNGAYIVSKASNTQHGIVKGDLDYVSILNGIIQVLKSDYATNVGSSGASYDYDDLLALFTEVANDIYKKNETYSATQIEQRLTDLLAMANLQDVLIGSYTNGQTVLASDLSPYNFVVALGNDDGSLYTGIFKPSEIVNDTVISLSPDVVDLTRDATSFTITTPTSVKLWGIKLDGITADEISYDGTNSGLSSTNVKTAIDEVVSEKADKLVLTNLVSNGDLLIPKASPNENEPLGFNYISATDISLVNGIAKFTANAQYGRLYQRFNTNNGDKIYYFANFKSDSPLVSLFGINNIVPANTYHSGSGNFEFKSNLQTFNGTFNYVLVWDSRTSDWTPIEVDYIGAINLTAIFGAGNEPTKEQMDRFINKVGFFGSFELDMKYLLDLDMKYLFELETDVEFINKNINSLFTNDIPNSSRRIYYYTNYSTGNQIATGAYFEQKIITNPQFSRIITYAVSGDTLPAVIAFYNSDVVFDDTTYMKTESKQFTTPNSTPRIYYSDVPSGCKAIIITSRNDVVGMETPYTKCSIDYLTKENNYLKQKNIFGKNKQYSHIFINDIYDVSNPKIPCQSSYDLSISKRLGFNIVEANIQKTATAGKYVVMHGVSGTIGGQLVYLNGDSANSVVIQNTTFDDLRNNFKYKSIYSKYQTKIISLEEWCGEVKKLGLMPLVQYVDDISLNIVKSFFGSDFILYNGSRDKHSGMIMRFSSSMTKQQMIDLCESIKPPLMINISDLSGFATDNLLIEAIQEVHKRGCLFGICGCYMPGAEALRAYKCGADFSASDSEVNPFDDGDIYNLNGELDFSDFTTNGVIVNDTISLTTGQTITVPPSASIPFAHKSRVLIIYNGALTIEICGRRNPTNIISNGEEEIEWSGFALNQAPYLTITATDTTVVKSIRFMAKKV